ncbi:hypothetical protein DEO72_LG9g1971 [Vigna unguiculata]|uniref:Uncharacterized protein n=1 Tax=Vigna unguiculata TaxID=3917 RepID=A0A4D6N4K8_VIGUN|nr:hypothetical protein DEO72_LG9g1971 [Vigna unguiculata]
MEACFPTTIAPHRDSATIFLHSRSNGGTTVSTQPRTSATHRAPVGSSSSRTTMAATTTTILSVHAPHLQRRANRRQSPHLHFLSIIFFVPPATATHQLQRASTAFPPSTTASRHLAGASSPEKKKKPEQPPSAAQPRRRV